MHIAMGNMIEEILSTFIKTKVQEVTSYKPKKGGYILKPQGAQR
jgi:hypothetical protein